jgi:hypothetical protein
MAFIHYSMGGMPVFRAQFANGFRMNGKYRMRGGHGGFLPSMRSSLAAGRAILPGMRCSHYRAGSRAVRATFSGIARADQTEEGKFYENRHKIVFGACCGGLDNVFLQPSKTAHARFGD